MKFTGVLLVLMAFVWLWPSLAAGGDEVYVNWCDCREEHISDWDLKCGRTFGYQCREGYFMVGFEQTMKCGPRDDIAADVTWVSTVTCCRPCLKLR